MSGIMDMFRSMVGGQPASMPGQQAVNPNANPNAQPAAQRLDMQQAPANAGADPANPSFGQEPPKADKSPLEDFAKLWTIDPKTDAAATPSLADFAFNVDQNKINQAVKGIDFTKVVTPEVMKAISSGGEGAMAAMLTAMNAMAQESVKNSVLVSAGIVEGGIKSSGATMEKALPSLVKKQNISNALREDNPLFNNPATAPMLGLLERQLATKFPNATPQEITQHARNYIVEFSKAASSLAPADNNGQQKQGAAKVPELTDFSSWEL